MAITRMSAAYQKPVETALQAFHYKERIYSARAGNAHYTHIWRILHSRNSRQICSRIRAPITQNSQNFRLKFTHKKLRIIFQKLIILSELTVSSVNSDMLLALIPSISVISDNPLANKQPPHAITFAPSSITNLSICSIL